MNTLLNIHVADQMINVLYLGLLGFLLGMAITPIYTHFAFRYRWWKKVRTTTLNGEEATMFNQLHAEKHRRRIPTMAGAVMLLAVGIITLIFNLDREQTYLPLAATLGAGGVGLIDDIINIRAKGSELAGLRARMKFLLITAVAALGGIYFYFRLGYDTVSIPFLSDNIAIGLLLIPLFMLVVVATANAVNITDGLDGLAGGLLVSAFTAYGVIAFLQENFGIAGFCITIVGVLLSYTWFNIFPARFFMGDVGSFALGTALGVVAMLTDTVFLLPLIGLVFVFEAGSSVLQVFSKRLFRHKLLLIAPIHHHFEAKGWPEAKVTMRFWIIGQVAAAAGLIVAVMGGHI